MKPSLPYSVIKDMQGLISKGSLREIHYLLDEHPSLLLRRKEFWQQGNWLHEAVLNGRHDLIAPLVQRGVPINGLNRIGETPLISATSYDTVAKGVGLAARALLEQGADPLIKNPYGYTALYLAVDRSCEPVLREILPLLPEVDTLCEGRTALFHATAMGVSSMVRLLLQSGANAEFQASDGCTIMDAALRSNNAATIELIETWTQVSRARQAVDSLDDLNLKPLAFAPRP